MISRSATQHDRSNDDVANFSDDLRQQSPSNMLSRGLASKVAIQRHRENELGGLRDQWNTFLIEGRDIAIRYII